jgi:hydroxymethylpyrimidine pyrophosphatase-like HAD family hydrolase
MAESTDKTDNTLDRDAPAPRWLLVSDLDDTLTGDAAALARFVRAVAATPGLVTAINSSRPLASVDQTLAGFPDAWRPAATIGAMGTELRVAGQPLGDWPERFTGWDRDAVDQALARLGFEAHEPALQGPYKVSYTVPAHRQQEAAEAVRATGAAVQIVVSGQTNFDVLPAAAGKAAAIERLLGYFHLPRATGLIVAGDSANDLAMFELAAQGIVVANASEALRGAVDPSRVYFAHSERAAGVLEGLAAWGVALPDAASESEDIPSTRR